MTIGPQRLVGVLVPQPVGHGHRRHASGDQLGGVIMPELVPPCPGARDDVADVPPRLPRRVPGDGPAVRVEDDALDALRSFAEVLEDPHGVVTDVDAPAAGLRLGGTPRGVARVVPDELPVDADHGVVEVAILADPPRSLQGTIGQVLVLVWAAMLVLGGGTGLLTVLQGWWWLERAGTVLCGFAMLVCGVAIGSLPVTQISMRLVTICLMMLGFRLFLVRFLKTSHSSYDPEK
jgi:hypothetical protein